MDTNARQRRPLQNHMTLVSFETDYVDVIPSP